MWERAHVTTIEENTGLSLFIVCRRNVGSVAHAGPGKRLLQNPAAAVRLFGLSKDQGSGLSPAIKGCANAFT